MATKKTVPAVKYELPKGCTAKDLVPPKWNAKIRHLYADDFELWYTEKMGWVIPTLFIRNPGSRARDGAAPRTYAIAVNNGGTCRVGIGPHVLARHSVYVTEANKTRLQWLLDLKHDGAVRSNETRDRISTRRAVGQEMRAAGRSSWLW